MAVRQRGRRIARKRPAPKRSAAPTAVERRRFVQLMVCGSAFVLLVAVKLLLPEKMAPVGARLAAAMERNMDMRQVFSVVGDFFAGRKAGEDSLDEVYQAVFAPEDPVVEKTTQPAELPAKAVLLTAEMTDREPEEQPPEGSADWYTAEELPDNVAPEPVELCFSYTSPLEGEISSPFGYREHPTAGDEKFHYGLDIAAEEGTDILCFGDGRVFAVGESSSYGKYLMVEHEDCTSLYAHCSAISVTSGTAVTAGQKIAEVGETGMATGPHLHLELTQNGKYLDPGYYVN